MRTCTEEKLIDSVGGAAGGNIADHGQSDPAAAGLGLPKPPASIGTGAAVDSASQLQRPSL